MKQIKLIGIIFFMYILGICTVSANNVNSEIKFHPIKHATMVIESKAVTIYVDPVEDPKVFTQYPKPDIILITDIHRDHLNKEIIDKIKQSNTLIIATKDAVAKLGEGKILNNGESLNHNGINIKAIPAYNLTEDRLKFHPKGRGNGYLITMSGKRIYISGDTEDIPEMRMLEDIDYAFICMNLPYTMTEAQAASAVLEFKPKEVIPYHYRGKNGFSDIDKFKKMVEKDGDIQVNTLSWY